MSAACYAAGRAPGLPSPGSGSRGYIGLPMSAIPTCSMMTDDPARPLTSPTSNKKAQSPYDARRRVNNGLAGGEASRGLGSP